MEQPAVLHHWTSNGELRVKEMRRDFLQETVLRLVVLLS